MPEAGRRAAAHQRGQPVHIRGPECQAGNQAVDVGERGEPVMNPFAKRVADDVAAGFAGGPSRGNDLRCAHGRPPSSLLLFLSWFLSASFVVPTTFGPKRK